MGHGPSGGPWPIRRFRWAAKSISGALSKATQGCAVLDQVTVLNYISPLTAFVMCAKNFGQFAVLTRKVRRSLTERVKTCRSWTPFFRIP